MKNFAIALSIVWSSSAFAGFCFTDSKKVDSCDISQIQSSIDASDGGHYGVVQLFEFVGSSKIKLTVIYPKNAPYNLAGKVTQNTWTFKRTANSYEDIDKDGCIERGKYKETATSVSTTPQFLSANCDSNRKSFFNTLKNVTSTYRKINF